MLATLRQRRRDDEEGFTLIELMVVVLIIAILLAIAIPTFLGARQRAQNRAAQSNIRNAFTAEKTFYTDSQAYTQTASDLTAIEPSLSYTNTAGSALASSRTVFVEISTTSVANDTVLVGEQSQSGNCYWIVDKATSGTTYGQNTTGCSAGMTVANGTQTAWT